jgi:hypothetical protein
MRVRTPSEASYWIACTWASRPATGVGLDSNHAHTHARTHTHTHAHAHAHTRTRTHTPCATPSSTVPCLCGDMCDGCCDEVAAQGTTSRPVADLSRLPDATPAARPAAECDNRSGDVRPY